MTKSDRIRLEWQRFGFASLQSYAFRCLKCRAERFGVPIQDDALPNVIATAYERYSKLVKPADPEAAIKKQLRRAATRELKNAQRSWNRNPVEIVRMGAEIDSIPAPEDNGEPIDMRPLAEAIRTLPKHVHWLAWQLAEREPASPKRGPMVAHVGARTISQESGIPLKTVKRHLKTIRESPAVRTLLAKRLAVGPTFTRAARAILE